MMNERTTASAPSLFRTFKHWSWSQLDTYRSCPFRARLKYLERIPELEPDRSKGEPASERGSRVHKASADFITADGPLIKELTSLQDVLADVRALYQAPDVVVECEKKHFFNDKWQPVTSDDTWWLIYIPDIKVKGPELNLTIDLKTGKKYGNEVKHYAQVELYAVCAWIEDPGYDEYKAELWYADAKDIVSHTFTPEHLEKARARLDKEVERMMKDTMHPPRPNIRTCRYCPYSPRGTGDCPVGV